MQRKDIGRRAQQPLRATYPMLLLGPEAEDHEVGCVQRANEKRELDAAAGRDVVAGYERHNIYNLLVEQVAAMYDDKCTALKCPEPYMDAGGRWLGLESCR